MGYIRHHGMMLTCWDEKQLRAAHAKALDLMLIVSEVSKGVVNSYESFAVFPDGSKEGWDTSDEFDQKRDRFVEFLRSDPSVRRVDWVEFTVGDENGPDSILRQRGEEDDT